jgi:hydroxymethylglutaryl-CoA reductase (NADPH)
MIYAGATEEFHIPLATYEAPLWPSTARGARISRLTDGITVTITDDRMSRSILLEAPSATAAATALTDILATPERIAHAVANTTRHGSFCGLHGQVAGNLIFLRIEMHTGDAAGHNMVTAAAEAALQDILATHPELRYGSLSANFCSDKKNSAVNGILGRGRYAIAEIRIPLEICRQHLRTDPATLSRLNQHKNWIGSVLAGSVRSANAHVANILLATYLATGQDAANIVEGSQAFTIAEEHDGTLLFSVTLPNLVVGTVGNGKHLPFVRENLARLGCSQPRPLGENARRLAAMIAAATLCSELSLMAALTNPGELMRTHRMLERNRS